MFPESNQYKQQGSALVLAIFIIVVMLAVVLSLSRLLLSSSEALVYEVQGTRAFLAAQSGLELLLTQVLPRDGNAACQQATLHFNDAGLEGCTASVSCQASALLPVGSTTSQLYQLTSVGHCTANEFVTSRTLVVEVRQ